MRATGLLGPRGEHVPCQFYQHSETCERVHQTKYPREHIRSMLDDGRCMCDLALDRHGWIRIGDDGWVTSPYCGSVNHVTQAQLDALWDLATTPGMGAGAYLMDEVTRLSGE